MHFDTLSKVGSCGCVGLLLCSVPWVYMAALVTVACCLLSWDSVAKLEIQSFCWGLLGAALAFGVPSCMSLDSFSYFCEECHWDIDGDCITCVLVCGKKAILTVLFLLLYWAMWSTQRQLLVGNFI